MCTMEMNDKEILKFIDIYRKWDILWNPSNVLYYNRAKKEDAWLNIAKETGRTVKQCKRKMVYLRAAMRREKMKIKKSIRMGKGTDAIYKSSWFAFQSLQFLLNKNNPSKTLSTIQTGEVTTKDGRLPEVTLENSEINSVSESTSTLSYHSKPSSKKRKVTDDQRLDNALEMVRNSASIVQDENFHFGNLIATKLRMYDDQTRCAIQNDIFNIFLRASRGYYTNNYASHCSPSYDVPNISSASFTSHRDDQRMSEDNNIQD